MGYRQTNGHVRETPRAEDREGIDGWVYTVSTASRHQRGKNSRRSNQIESFLIKKTSESYQCESLKLVQDNDANDDDDDADGDKNWQPVNGNISKYTRADYIVGRRKSIEVWGRLTRPAILYLICNKGLYAKTCKTEVNIMENGLDCRWNGKSFASICTAKETLVGIFNSVLFFEGGWRRRWKRKPKPRLFSFSRRRAATVWQIECGWWFALCVCLMIDCVLIDLRLFLDERTGSQFVARGGSMRLLGVGGWGTTCAYEINGCNVQVAMEGINETLLSSHWVEKKGIYHYYG